MQRIGSGEGDVGMETIAEADDLDRMELAEGEPDVLPAPHAYAVFRLNE